MHVLVGGIPANEDSSTEVWQYRQSMPLPPTWRSWLNWRGCSRGTCACVTHGDRLMAAVSQRRPPTKKSAPKMLTRAIVFALRWKICDIDSTKAQRVSLPRVVANVQSRRRRGRVGSATKTQRQSKNDS